MAASDEDYLSGDDFEGVLTTLCCYDYGVNLFEEVENITTD